MILSQKTKYVLLLRACLPIMLLGKMVSLVSFLRNAGVFLKRTWSFVHILLRVKS
jgi:hypothetical protein